MSDECDVTIDGWCNAHQQFYRACKRDLANPPGVSSASTSCSHGGEERLRSEERAENAARSHDSARFEEQCEWVRQTFMGYDYGSFHDWAQANRTADWAAEQFRKRFEPTAVDRQSAAAEGQSSAEIQGEAGG